jgi:hypothetical protein
MLLYARDLRRTLHLARQREQQLADTNARLTRLDKLKSDFLHFVSHELRTPLQHFAALDLMDASLPPREMEEMLGVLRAGYDRLNRLVRAGVTYLEMAAEAPSCDLATFSASQYHRDLAARCTALPRVELAPLTRLSQFEACASRKFSRISPGIGKVFTTNRRQPAALAWAGLVSRVVMRGGGWAGNSSFSLSKIILTSASGWVYRGRISHRPSVVGMWTSII